jgi:hypothetical protein
MTEPGKCIYCDDKLWFSVDYGPDHGMIRTNCPICNPHPGIKNASTRKQRIEEMCKIMCLGNINLTITARANIVMAAKDIIDRIDDNKKKGS